MTEQMFVYQSSFDDLGTPLSDVTFVVIDLETTGASPRNSAVTEVGAIKVRGGECLGTYQTLVDPGLPIPPEITVLTGITQAMVLNAPRITAVLPSLLEFCHGAVIVGHNVRFDMSFLNAALQQNGYPKLTAPTIDTLSLARRLVRTEVPNCKLKTLATRLRLNHHPSHRALDDAFTTADLLHVLIERATALGVLGLEDLLQLPKISGNPQAHKLNLTENLPRKPGVYLFRDARNDVLYVGKATNLRARVRSYFSTDDRRKVAQLLRETQRIDHQVCANGLEAAVLEIRMIHKYLPRFNRQGTAARKYPYIKLTLNEHFPRFSIVRKVSDDGALYLGPLPSRKTAKQCIEAIESVSKVRRCGLPSRRKPFASECISAQLGVSCCPCSGATPAAEYDAVIAELVQNLLYFPDRLLVPLAVKIAELAAQQRYEEAVDARNRAAALVQLLQRHRRFDLFRRAQRVRLSFGESWVELINGQLWQSGTPGSLNGSLAIPTLPGCSESLANAVEPLLLPNAVAGVASSATQYLAVPQRNEADELLTVAAWLERNIDKVIIEEVQGVLASPLPALPTFQPAQNNSHRHSSSYGELISMQH